MSNMEKQGRDVPLNNAISRFCASFLTWPVEKGKLIYQAEGIPVVCRLSAISLQNHLRGALASCTQRGASAFIMFRLQNHASSYTKQATSFRTVNEGLAGILAGACSAPFHTYWELMKVQVGQPVTLQAYRMALLPMLLRHSVFDGTFFYINDLFSGHSSGFRFGVAAATASCFNLVFDVWKTQRMHRFPRHTSLLSVISSMHIYSFCSNYAVKGFELSLNWALVGTLKDLIAQYDGDTATIES